MITKAFYRAYFCAAKSQNPKVFFDIHINNQPSGKLVFEVWVYFDIFLQLFSDKVPKTAENFRRLW